MAVVIGGFSPEKLVLSPDFKRWLAENNPLGMTLTEADVQAWWDLKWPTYSTHGYTKHRRAIVSWWSRVREDELEAARERSRRMTDEKEATELEVWAGSEPDTDREFVTIKLDHRKGASR